MWMGAAAFLSIFAVLVACADRNSPTLTGGKVTPENGAWGSTFIFEVVYTDPDNLMPAGGYPRVYIGGEMNEMEENDPADDDVTDGKSYRYEWTPAVENDKKLPLFENFEVNNRYLDPGEEAIFSGYLIDDYSFYFYVENPQGENARDPATGEHSGPKVAVNGKTVHLFEPPFEDNIIGSGGTAENGYFSISIEAPSSGSFAYRASFEGDENHKNLKSDMECLITFDAFTISAISIAFSAILILILMFLLSRGVSRAQYLKPLLIGFLVAMVFTFVFVAGFIGLIMAGAVAGYLYAREVRGWSKHLRVGGLVALFLFLVLCLVRAYFIKETAAFYVLEIVGRSMGNSELLELLILETIFSALFYIVFLGVGAILGGLLRKLLKPAEQRPVTVARPTNLPQRAHEPARVGQLGVPAGRVKTRAKLIRVLSP